MIQKANFPAKRYPAVTAGFRKASGFLKNVSAFKQKDFGVLMKTPKSFLSSVRLEYKHVTTV
ncbi:hypothetical protein BACCOPRO_00568 [Phocaeicola coprophilus DSM 18228 = JCM 13818]|uniref:Uncharacterized protein n=1 Tax=Phocaeicola coprophilus DSM 18228 = JCM 13818 TaxID=547042 RepID=S0F5B5_9BACT|nr:hypothetical protein BACCOPRO_00568 [Phocaeicola coprophilus DSM 18228 = JCM 13818]